MIYDKTGHYMSQFMQIRVTHGTGTEILEAERDGALVCPDHDHQLVCVMWTLSRAGKCIHGQDKFVI